MRVLAVSGSLQRESSNTALLRAIRDSADDAAQVTLFERVADIPHFNPDLDVEPAPAAVAELRAAVAAADGTVIATPEYAHEMPGSLKNALDWLVGSGELYGKPVVVLSASPWPTRGTHAREALERTLTAQGARVVVSRTVVVGGIDDGRALAHELVTALRPA